MKRPTRILLYAFTACMLAAGGMALAQSFSPRDIGQSDFVPSPRLIAPATSEVNLAGRDSLEFKWSPFEGDPVRRDYYDFRLYKGTQALAGGLIFKTRTAPREWSLTFRADMFESETFYTWSVRQVYTGSIKSRRSTQTFKVIRR